MAIFGLCPGYRPLRPDGDVQFIVDGLGRKVAAVCDEGREGKAAMAERAQLICRLLNEEARTRGHQFRGPGRAFGATPPGE